MHVRALHFRTQSDFVALASDLCALDDDCTITIEQSDRRHSCTPTELPATAAALALLAGEHPTLTLTGRALANGPWQITLSASPARPSLIDTTGGTAFAAALAGLVQHAAQVSTLADLHHRRPLLPGS